MAHEKVYGICENKCRVEVVSKESLLDLIYPVGAIYMSVNNVNPGTLFGGTWVAWGSGRVPVGVNTSDSNFNSVEKTGGESRHTLTSGELPSDLDVMAPMTYSIINQGTGDAKGIWEAGDGFYSKITLKLVGLGASHNNLQPYITCYMWKRTA